MLVISQFLSFLLVSIRVLVDGIAQILFESSFWLISSSSPIIGLGRNPEHPPNLARETTYKTVS